MSEITIARRFRGPEDSGNGGYTCGMVARFIEGDAEITLRKPPPLDLALEVRPIAGGVDVYDGDDLIAEGRSCQASIHRLPESRLPHLLRMRDRPGR